MRDRALPIIESKAKELKDSKRRFLLSLNHSLSPIVSLLTFKVYADMVFYSSSYNEKKGSVTRVIKWERINKGLNFDFFYLPISSLY